MSKHNDDAKRLKKIAKILVGDPDLKKKARKALEAEADVIRERMSLAPDPVTEILDEAHDVNEAGKRHIAHLKRIAELAVIVVDLDAKKKAKAAVEEELKGYRDATVDRANEREVEAHNLAEWALGGGHFLTSDIERARTDAKLAESDEEIKARIQAKRKEREGATPAEENKADRDSGGDVEDWTNPHEGEYETAKAVNGQPTRKKKPKDLVDQIIDEAATESIIADLNEAADAADRAGMPNLAKEIDKANKKVKANKLKEAEAIVDELLEETAPATTLADPEEEQPRDRWGRPLIVPPGGGKAKGYRRTTTYIDVIDDKTALIDWGRRIVVTGVAAIEQKIAGDATLVNVDEIGTVSVLERVSDANRALAKGAKKAAKRLAAGEITDAEHADIEDELEKAHKAALNDLVQEAYRAGDGFVKAETGTRIHKLMEIFDTEGPAALGKDSGWNVTESEWRDLNAIAALYAKLNVEVLAVEQFVVVDELEVGGTLDRRVRYDSPTLGKRISAIADLKTGRVDYGAGKMTRQLAIYQKGKGYDWRKPEERVTFRTNPDIGLIVHIPAGSGVATAYEIDLKKGWEGVQLCAKVYAHRSETTTTKVFAKAATSLEAE